MSRWNYMKNGQKIPLTVKVEDTLPIGAEIDIPDGTPIPEGWVEVDNVLYENSNGTTGNATLNDDISNYNYLEIFYKEVSGGRLSSMKIMVQPSITISPSITILTSNALIVREAQFTISGTSLANVNHYEYNNGTFNTNQNIAILKILGYK